MGKPEMKKTVGHWALSGPGWAAEWNQGGESGFLSIATAADDDKAVVTKTVDIPIAGTYYVWVRGRAATVGDDSLHVGLDGAAVASADRVFRLKPAYGWTNATANSGVATINIATPGIHTLNVWMWEDGTVFDKLLLTTSSTFVPTGIGPAESPHTGPDLDYTGGFAGATGLQLNGSATSNGSAVRLTGPATNQAGSVFSSSQVDVTGFATTFDFQLTSAAADGFAFVIQGAGSTALGSAGQGLGYQGIGNSVAVKLDLSDDAGGPSSSTGLYTNGAPPTGGIDLSPSGIDLHSGHNFRVSIAYAGGTLYVTIRDLVSNVMAQQSYAVDIASVVGGNTAFVGFTGATGTQTATQDILNWGFWNG